MSKSLTSLPDLAPSADFTLNVFLLQISDDLTEEDFKRLKFMCRGKYGIGKANLEKLEQPYELFEILREMGLLNENNMITLQAMLWQLPRQDLQRKYVEYVKSHGSAIHFVVPKTTPENGYKYLQFHIKGKDVESYSKHELEKLRSMIATNLLNIPPEFVIISGIEPSNSLIITFMIPNDAISSLQPAEVAIFKEFGVNGIMIDENFFQVDDVTKTENVSSVGGHMEEETRQIMLRHRQKERELENARTRIIEHKKHIQKLESKISYFTDFLFPYFIAVLFQQVTNLLEGFEKFKQTLENPVQPLRKMCAFAMFRNRLDSVKKAKYDENLICDLLDAQALVFHWHIQEKRDVEISHLTTKIRQMEKDLAMVTWQRDKLSYYHEIGEKHKIMSEREEYILSALVQNLPIQIEQRVVFSQRITEECIDYVFHRLNKDIPKSDIKILLAHSPLSGKDRRDAEQSVYNLLRNTFLQALHKAGKNGFELRSFLENILKPLQRRDLLQKVDAYVQDYHISCQLSQAAASKPKQSKRSAPSFTHKKGKQKQALPHFQRQIQQTNSSVSDKSLKEMNERLEKIENMISNVSKLPSNPFATFGNTDMDKYLSLFDTSMSLSPALKGCSGLNSK